MYSNYPASYTAWWLSERVPRYLYDPGPSINGRIITYEAQLFKTVAEEIYSNLRCLFRTDTDER